MKIREMFENTIGVWLKQSETRKIVMFQEYLRE